jgi:predicted dehydrogenase
MPAKTKSKTKAKPKTTAAARPAARPRRAQVLNAAVIGVGMGRAHIEGYQRADRARVAAICDINRERAEQVAKQHDIPQIYTDYHQLLKRPDIDVVSVATPNYLHAEITIAALKAGKHVCCEKPLAMNATEGQAMVDAARKAGKLLMIALNNRYRADTQTLKRFIEAGELGHIYYGKTAWLRRSGVPGGWFRVKEQSGGGPLIDLGVHMLDLTWWLMGCPRPVAASGQSYPYPAPEPQVPIKGGKPETPVEDLAVALLRFEGGQTIFVEVSWVSHLERETQPVQIFGTQGGASLGPLRMYKDILGMPVDLEPKVRENLGGHIMEIMNFVDCILDGTPLIAPGDDGLAVQKMLDAIYESARVGHEVAIS